MRACIFGLIMLYSNLSWAPMPNLVKMGDQVSGLKCDFDSLIASLPREYGTTLVYPTTPPLWRMCDFLETQTKTYLRNPNQGNFME